MTNRNATNNEKKLEDTVVTSLVNAVDNTAITPQLR
jgi:hypothetical protein